MPRHFTRGLLMTAALGACSKETPPAPTPPTAAIDAAATTTSADTLAPPPDTTAPEPASWQALAGSVALPGGLALRLLVKRSPDAPNTWTLDIPDQNLANGPLTDLVENGDTLSFAFQPKGAPPAARGVFTATRASDGTYRGHLEQAGQKFPLELTVSTTSTLPARSRPQTPQPPFPYPTIDLKVAVDGGELACTLALPATASKERPAPAVIMRTGSGAQDRDETLFEHKPFLLLADALARAGVASLRCDDRGAGNSVAARRDDDLAVFLADAKATLAALASRDEIDPTKVGVLGHSEGAMTAAELIGGATDGPPIDTPKGPVRPAFAVLLAGPGRSGREILVHQNRELILGQGGTPEQAEAVATAADGLFLAFEADADTLAARAGALADATLAAAGPNPPEPRELLVARFQALSKEPWMRSFVKNDPRPHLAKASVPVLALFGDKDTQVPKSDAEALRKAASDKVEIEVIPNVNHLFQPARTGTASEYALIETTMEPAVLARITTWVARTVSLSKP